jgi:hypothetical protein
LKGNVGASSDGYRKLFRMLGSRVATPDGRGVLEQVLGAYCVRVTLDEQDDPPNPKMTTLHWTEIQKRSDGRPHQEERAENKLLAEARESE